MIVEPYNPTSHPRSYALTAAWVNGLQGGDVLDLDHIDSLRAKEQRRLAAETANKARQLAAQKELEADERMKVMQGAERQRMAAHNAAITIQGSYKARTARQALRWRFWHTLACVLQRSFRSHQARAVLRHRRLQESFRKGLNVAQPPKPTWRNPHAHPLAISAAEPKVAAVRPAVAGASSHTDAAIAQKKRDMLRKKQELAQQQQQQQQGKLGEEKEAKDLESSRHERQEPQPGEGANGSHGMEDSVAELLPLLLPVREQEADGDMVADGEVHAESSDTEEMLTMLLER
jgi:hypothetical protein